MVCHRLRTHIDAEPISALKRIEETYNEGKGAYV